MEKDIKRKLKYRKYIFFIGLFALPMLAFSQNLIWANVLGGVSETRITSFVVDAEENIYVTGSFKGTVDFDPGKTVINHTSAGDHDIFLAKFSSKGNHIWSFSIGGNYWDVGKNIVLGKDGFIYICGEFGGNGNAQNVDFNPGAAVNYLQGAGNFDIFLAKFDTSGKYQWAKNINGPGWEMVNGLVLDENNNIYITGFYQADTDFDPGAKVITRPFAGGFLDGFAAKYTSQGNYAWVRNFSSSGQDRGNGLVLGSNGVLYVAGHFESTVQVSNTILTSKGGLDGIIIAYDTSQGDLIETVQIGGKGEDTYERIASTPSGNIIGIGYFEQTVNFNPRANSDFRTSKGQTDAFVTKHDYGLNYISTISFGGTGDDKGVNLFVNENIYAIGVYEDTLNIGAKELVSAGQKDIFIVQFDAFNLLIDAKSIQGIGDNWGVDIKVHAQTLNTYIAGNVKDEVDYEPGIIIDKKGTSGDDAAFIAKFNGDVLNSKEVYRTRQVHIYPNPITRNLKITSNGHFQELNMTLYDTRGKQVDGKSIGPVGPDKSVILDMSSYPKGTYLLQVSGKGFVLNQQVSIK